MTNTPMKVARVNDLTKEAMVQSIKEGDLRFLTVNIFYNTCSPTQTPLLTVRWQVLTNKTHIQWVSCNSWSFRWKWWQCEQRLFSWTMVVLFEQFLASYGQYPKMIQQHATMSFDQETYLYLIFLRLIVFGPFCNRINRFLTGPIFFFRTEKGEAV